MTRFLSLGWCVNLNVIKLVVTIIALIIGSLLIGAVVAYLYGVTKTEVDDWIKHLPEPHKKPLFNSGDLVLLNKYIKWDPFLYLKKGSQSRAEMFEAFSKGPLEIRYCCNSSAKDESRMYAIKGYDKFLPEYWLVCVFNRD